MGTKDADWWVMSRINLLSFFDVNQTEHGSEVLNGLYQRFFSPLRDLKFRRSEREKTSGIQGSGQGAIGFGFAS